MCISVSIGSHWIGLILTLERHNLIAKKLVVFLFLLLAGCVNGPLSDRQAFAGDDKIGFQPAWTTAQARADQSLDQAVPTPETIIGHAMGDGAVRYQPLVRYLDALADASPLVSLTPYAESHEGRTLYFLTITSEANHAKLDEIKADNAKLADPRKLADEAEGEGIIERLPGIAWLAYSIHGDELSSTDAAVQVAYQLAAGTDEHSRRLRDELVIHIDPLMNPDGRERYLGQLQHLTGKIDNVDFQSMRHWGLWSAGRGNHYLFDLNRDWLMQVHPETRGRAAKILEWNPHLVVDSHEMGALDTYLFDPPREPHNVNLSKTALEWRRRFSADQARSFDRHGWSYYTREWYEEWYPGYTNAWAGLQGAIGILYEQAGVNAGAVKQAAGQIVTYRDAVHHQAVSTMANLESLRANRRDILHDYASDRQWAVDSARSGTEVFLVSPMADRALLNRFVDLLSRQGIEYQFAAGEVHAGNVVDALGTRLDSKSFPAGTLIVHAAQPRRRLLRAILEFDPHMTQRVLDEERESLENHEGTLIYDTTSWNLGMAYGLDAYWADTITDVSAKNPAPHLPALPENPAAYGYLIDGASGDVYSAAARLLEREVKVRVASKPFAVGEQEYKPGTLLMRGHENQADLLDLVRASVADLDVIVRSAETARSTDGPDLGGQRFSLLTPPRIAIATQWPIATTSFGATWHLLDARMGLRVSPIALQHIAGADLRKYNVIVLPDTWSPGAMRATINEDVAKKLKRWLDAGGTLIAMGRSAAFIANEKLNLSAVRLRRDVLDQLPVYKEARERERSAWHIEVNADDVWLDKPTHPTAEEGAAKKEEASSGKKANENDLEVAKRWDQWARLFRPNGAFMAASFNPRHWLTFGLSGFEQERNQLPVMFSGDSALMSKYPVHTPVRLDEADDLRLSGLLWPEARQRWQSTAYATVERVGYGQVILFASDPFLRGYTEGTGRLLLNALIIGPGMGTSQPVPW